MENLLLELKSKAESIRYTNPAPDKKFVWPYQFKQEVVSLVNHNKFTYQQIASVTGISASTIYGWVNIKNRVKNKKSFNKVKVINDLPKSSVPQSKITISWDSGINISGLNFSDLESLLKQGLL